MPENKSQLTNGIAQKGLIGGAIALLVCIAPVLLGLAGFAGVSAWAGWLDKIVMPLLLLGGAAVFVYLKVKKARS